MLLIRGHSNGNSQWHSSSHAPVFFDKIKKIVKHYEFFWKNLKTHTYELFTLLNFFQNEKTFPALCSKKTNQCFQKWFFRSILTTHFFFFVQSERNFFSFQNFVRMWTCVCLQFFLECFIMFYYFFYFVEKNRSMWARVLSWGYLSGTPRWWYLGHAKGSPMKPMKSTVWPK